MRIILVGYGVVGKGVTTILARRYSENLKDTGFNPKIVAIADIDGAVINPRGLSPEKLDAIKQRGYPISKDPDFGRPGISALDVIESVEAEVVVEVTPVNIKTGEPGLSHITKAFKTASAHRTR
jgi:homoserine dehydrogenase